MLCLAATASHPDPGSGQYPPTHVRSKVRKAGADLSLVDLLGSDNYSGETFANKHTTCTRSLE